MDLDDKSLEQLAYSLFHAAQLTSLSESHLRNAIKTGRLRAFKEGKRWVITRAALVAYIESCSEAGAVD